jgi:hypothetical protein
LARPKAGAIPLLKPAPPVAIVARSELETAIIREPAWIAGAAWGFPREGHPEGAVKYHIAEVLANLDRINLTPEKKANLRIAGLAHDTFKYQVDRNAPRIPPNEHGFLAAQWLTKYIQDPKLLALVELHDEGYRAWQDFQHGAEPRGWRRITQIVKRLDDEIQMFSDFYWADNNAGDKSPEQLTWFIERLADCGVIVTLPIQS